MNVVDSSGWLEYFADGPNARFFAPAIETLEKLVVRGLFFWKAHGSEVLTVVTAVVMAWHATRTCCLGRD